MNMNTNRNDKATVINTTGKAVDKTADDDYVKVWLQSF